MSNVDKIAKDLAGIIKSSDSKATAPYDTKATVKKVENGTAWVQIPGGVDETPVQMTLNAKEGDTVQVRVSGGRAWITGNGTNPPTDDTRANQAYNIADSAIVDAQRAKNAADNAEASAADAKATADAVHGIAVEAKQDAEDAEAAAGQAQISAENASEYAARALGNLSTVQSVTETLNWITAHGTMTLTTDTSLDPTHVYFVRDNNGDYEVGNYHYSVVTEPDVADISTYYVLSIDESLNNYVGTHLAVTSEGLWLLPDAGGNKVLIATGGQGHTYEYAGTYIVDENGNVSAQFLENGTTIYGPSNILITHLGYGLGKNRSGGMSYSPYYSLGKREGSVGNYSVAVGSEVVASGYAAFAEGSDTEATGFGSHAEGSATEATGDDSHAEGYETEASGHASHAQNEGSRAVKRAQTVLGTYNYPEMSVMPTTHPSGIDAYGWYPVIVGNGTSVSNRSNALTVDWLGEVKLYLDVDSSASKTTAATSGEDKDLFNAIRDLGWYDDVIA